MRWAWLLPTVLLAACAAPAEIVGENDQAIVDGEVETTGYQAAGFVLDVDSHSDAPVCGAVLVAGDIAVTSGSCVDPDVGYAVGFRSGLYRVAEVVRHPSFSATANNIAVLRLVRTVDGVEPATIDTVSAAGCGFRAVGFGQESADPHSKSGDKKSMGFCVDTIETTELKGHSVDGAACIGDNGGPLMVTGQNKVVGILSRRADSTPTCTKAGKLVMTRLSSHRSFLDPFILGL